MKKIIFFDWYQSSTEWYRLIPLDYLESPEFTITRSTEHNITYALLNAYDIIILSRPFSIAGANLIKLAKDMGKKVIIDADDNLLAVNKESHVYDLYERERPNTKLCLKLADEVWVTTQGIKDTFSKYNKNVHIIPNALNDHVYKKNKPFKYAKKVLWRGGMSHIYDIYQPHVTEWIVNLVNTNPEVKFYWSGGQRFEFIEYRVGSNFYIHSGDTTIQFFKWMRDLNASVFFYPLADNEFNRGKSCCSWLESVSAGSAYFGMNEFPEFNKPGIMPLKYMPDIMKMPDILEKMHKESWGYISDCLLLSTVNKIRLERLLEI